jgi:protein O-GlcNAc transferase
MPITPHELRGLSTAMALQNDGRLAEAAGAYTALLEGDPDSPVLLHLLGRARGYLGQVLEAEGLLRRCLEIDPTISEVYQDLTIFLRCQGRCDEAVETAGLAVYHASDAPYLGSELILTMENSAAFSPEDLLAQRQAWARRYASVPREPQAAVNRDPDRPLRVGYVSADFALHSAMFSIGPVLASHSAQVEAYAYSGVTDQAEDAMTRWLKEHVKEWRPAWAMTDSELAAQIRADAIDILVDLSGHTGGNRLTLFARKPAPIQITAWGYPTGTGMAQMDYLFADAVTVPPEEEAFYTEEIVRLPTFTCYAPPEGTAAIKRPRGPVTFGLMNNPRKLTPATLAAWVRIAQAVPESQFLYQSSQYLPHAAIERLFAPFTAGGIAASRIHVLPPQSVHEHLAQLGRVDINLDPFPYGGGVTTLDALHQGVPTLALLGHGLPGRTSAAIMQAAGLGWWVALDVDEYVRKAVLAANEVQAQRRLRANKRERLLASPLGNRRRYLAAVEDTYRALWQRYLAQTAPRAQSVA